MVKDAAQATPAPRGGASTTSSSELSREMAGKEIERVMTSDQKERAQQHRDRSNTVQTAPDYEIEGYEDYTRDLAPLHKSRTHTLGLLKLRAEDDHDPTDWWFASTAIPLIAATFAPMANLLSIAALVVGWRAYTKSADPSLKYSTSEPYEDEAWCYKLNAASLACGFAGNLFLLFNFTRRVRYIVALPLTIFFFYTASGILIAIIICVDKYTPPKPDEVYSQAFWHAIIAASLYLFNSMILMANMLGYFLGHYPQHFTLTDEQRNLILQTMLFFLWLGGGAGVFTAVESNSNWGYPNALYFCDVTILTIGFGDYFATDDLGRGLVFPFSVGGTIILGLMVSSIHKFARELSKDKVVRQHVEKRRVDTLSRSVTLDQAQAQEKSPISPLKGRPLNISRPSEQDAEKIQHKLEISAEQEGSRKKAVNFEDPRKEDFLDSDPKSPLPTQFISPSQRQKSSRSTFQKSLRSLTLPLTKPVSFTANSIRRVASKNQKQIIMLEERDRFNAMRSIQTSASTFKRYYALTLSIICFSLLWCIGALVFYYAEAETQQLNYFQGLYLCYVSLLTIGYGDLSPKSNAGKAFFVLWSLIAVPTMTILVSDLGDTVIGGFKRGLLENDLGLTSTEGTSRNKYRSVLQKFKSFAGYGQHKHPRKRSIKTSQLEEGGHSDIMPVDEPDPLPKTIEELAHEEMSEAEMMRQLAYAIRRAAEDLKTAPDKKYSYEEWVEFTRLIRFSRLEASKGPEAIQQLDQEEVTEGLVEWDWLDEHSPMTSEQSESEWVLDRLCESLLRIFKKNDAFLAQLSSPSTKGPSIPKEPTSPPASPIGITQPFRASYDLSSPAEPEASKLPGMSAVSKFFKGDIDYGTAPQWSKKGQAKRGTTETPSDDIKDRRRSSVSVGHKRHGPFALESPRLDATSPDLRGRRRSSGSLSYQRQGPFALGSPQLGATIPEARTISPNNRKQSFTALDH